MIARDEEEMLPDCLESVRGEVDEIILVDTGSRDGTAELARSLGARVFSFRWRRDFAAARNASLERAAGDWILILDCDERLDPASRGLLRQAAASGCHDGYLVHLVNLPACTERWLALRLFRNRPGVRYQGRIHEQLRFTGSAGACDATIHHLGHQPEVIAMRDKRARNRELVEAACAETASGDPVQHSFYLFYRAFGATGTERGARLAEWVGYVESHPELERNLVSSCVSPWIPVGLAHYAWQLSDAGIHGEAGARARRLVEHHGESPLLDLVLARAYVAAGDFSDAERSLARLETGRTALPYLYFPIDYDLIRRRGRRLGAEIQERAGRLAEAERSYRDLVEADVSDLASAMRLVCVLFRRDAYRQALDTLEAFPALLNQGLPEVDCLGLALSLLLQSAAQITAWTGRVRASTSPLAVRMLERVSRQRPGVSFQVSDFPELEAGASSFSSYT
jgi:tetratricopeptide (TPR) repeat protein